MAEVREYTGGFSEEHALTRIKDLRTLPYIRRTFVQLINLYEMRFDQWRYLQRTSNFTVPKRLVKRLEIEENEYVEFCTKELSAACADIAMQLRRSIVEATSNATWDDTVLEALRLRMSEIQVHINHVCRILDVPHLRLVSATDPWW